MDSKKEIQHVYLVGAKSLGAYGGYETFVYKLTEYHQNKENIKYHVACKANGDGCMDESKFEGVTKINDHEFEFHNAHCFKIDVPQIGSAQAIYYDVAALKACCEHIKKNHIPHPIVYIMACRIGPFAGHFYREIHKLGGTVFLNPDGVELSSDNKKQFYIPEGFAHGFYVISDIAVVCFKVSDYWHPNDEIGIPWNDTELKINWPIKENEMPIIADKDLHYDSFSLLKEKLHQREE